MDNPSVEAQPGDILYGRNNKNIRGLKPHFIIYLRPDKNSEDQFLGAMLTTSPRFSNIGLKESHFEPYESQGKNWQVVFKESFIAPELYYKKNDWKPFYKVGQLTEEGLSYINEKIGNLEPKQSSLNRKLEP